MDTLLALFEVKKKKMRKSTTNNNNNKIALPHKNIGNYGNV